MLSLGENAYIPRHFASETVVLAPTAMGDAALFDRIELLQKPTRGDAGD